MGQGDPTLSSQRGHDVADVAKSLPRWRRDGYILRMGHLKILSYLDAFDYFINMPYCCYAIDEMHNQIILFYSILLYSCL